MKLTGKTVGIWGGKVMLAAFFGLAGISAGATTYYSGKGPARGGLSAAVKWYTNEALTDEANPQPTPTENDGNTYVFISSEKVTLPVVFPEGTHVCFGTDGSEIGTKAASYAPNLDSADWTVPDAVVYGMQFTPNYNSGGHLYGNYRLVKTTKPITFGGSSLGSGKTYGMYLSGTFTGNSDVLVSVAAMRSADITGSSVYVHVRFNGDFSGYKGKFDSVAWNANLQPGGAIVHFMSASSMGDQNTPCNDAVTLRHNGMLQIDDAVTQTSARGITLDLSAGQHASLYAPNAAGSWTLRAPLYGGSAGTLRKVGAGTVTLAGPMTAKDILVAEGTLAIDPGAATFASGTTITVASGATLVNPTGQPLNNVTVSVQDGGTYVGFTVPFDGTDTTPRDLTSLSAADFAALDKPVCFNFSQALPLPINATNRWVVATFSAAAGVSADDFVDCTERTYNLPTTWLETETADGTTTLYVVARPAFSYTNVNKNIREPTSWADGKAPHAGADYYDTLSASYSRTGGGSAVETYNFNAETFTLINGLWDFAQDFYTPELRLRSNSKVIVVHASNSSGVTSPKFRPRILRGKYVVDKTATDSAPAVISIDMYTDYADLRQELAGEGTLQIKTEVRTEENGGLGVFPIYLNCDAAGFAGRLDFKTDTVTNVMDVYVTNGLAFGGALPAYSADAVRLRPATTVTDGAMSITATRDVTVDAANRGWSITSGTLCASNGVTFTFSPPTLTLGAKLRKTGGGTLALGCGTVGADTAFAVEEGFVKALSAGCCTNLHLSVADGAGIEVDLEPADAVVASKGLVAKSVLPAATGGRILVAPKIAAGFGRPSKFSAVICTVTAEQADLTDVLKPAGVGGYGVAVRKDAVTYAEEGLVSYSAEWVALGLRFIVR